METFIATPGTIRCIEDIPFGDVTNETGQVETLHLDLYLPPQPGGEPLPTILWFHGGGFRPGNDKRQRYIPRFARIFAALGYAGIAPDYRVRVDPTPDMAGTINDAVADGRLALDWARSQGPQYGIDPTCMALGGGSAGGMLVTNLVNDPCQPVEALKDGIFAVIDLWGTPNPPTRRFQQVSPTCPPTFIAHGTADQLVAYEFSVNYAAELEAAGIPCQLMTLPGEPHTPFMRIDEISAEAALFLELHRAKHEQARRG